MAVDNRPSALKSKVALRSAVLDLVRPSSVFEAFCGVGKLYDAVWRRADSHVGCDLREWRASEHYRRFVADNRTVLCCLDLSQYNVFDLDAYGSPWEQALIIAARRKWAPTERGAIVVTDGSTMSVQYGNMFPALSLLSGVQGEIPRRKGNALQMHDLCLRGFCAKSGLKPLSWRRATSASGVAGSHMMIYSAVVFEAR